jgi:zinc protease
MTRTLTLLLLIAASAQAQTTPPQSYKALKFPPLRQIALPKIEETTLPNGVKLYLLEEHTLPQVRGTALIRTGNLFDPASKVGLAGLTGDAIRSGGTSAKSGDQIDEELENIAASVESQIGETLGTVSFSTLKERTDEVLATFRDVLTDPKFRQDKLDLAKAQTRSGISRRNDDARGIAQREFTNILYGRNTPYGWDLEYSTIDNIKRDDVVAFYQRYYFPANTILAIQGDFNAPEMKAKIEKLFASWTVQQPPVPAFPKVVNDARPGIYTANKPDVTQTTFFIGHMGGFLNDKDYAALEVMADILGGGFKSRLFLKVRTQLGYAYDVGADWGANYDHPGLFTISGSTKSASTAATLKAITDEVNRIRTAPVTAQELETAKQTVVNSFVFNFDTPSKTLNRLLTYRYFGYPDDFIFRYQKAVEAVTVPDVLRVAKQYLDPAKFVTVAVGNNLKFDVPVTELDLSIPDPKATVARALAAMGGDKLLAVKDMTVTAAMQLDPTAGGLRVSQTTQWLAPGYFRQENVLPFGKILTYTDGKTGWSSTPQGFMPAPQTQLDQVAFETFRIWPALLKNESLRDAGDGKIEISDPAGHKVLLTFDPKTGLPATAVYNTPTVEETYSDWQETDGVRLPRKITLKQAGKHFGDATISEIKLNRGLTSEQMSKKPEALKK